MKVIKIVLLLIFFTDISVLVGMTEAPNLFDTQAQLEKQKKRMAIFVAWAKELIAKDDSIVIDRCKDCKGACVHCTAQDDATTPFKGSARLFEVMQKKFLADSDEGTWTKVDLHVQDRTVTKAGETGASTEGQRAKPEGAAATPKTSGDDIVYKVDDSDVWLLCGQIEGQPANTQTTEPLTGLTQDMQKLNLKEEDLADVIEMVEIKEATITDEDIAAAIEPFLKELKKHLLEEFERNKSTTSGKKASLNKDKSGDAGDEREQLKRVLEDLFNKKDVIEAIALQALVDERIQQDRAVQGYESTPVKLVKAVLPGSRDVACIAAVGKVGYDIAKPHVVQWYKSLTPVKVVSMMLNGGASLLLPQGKAIKLGMLFFNTLHSFVHICFVE